MAASSELEGETLLAYLQREEVTLGELERWRSLLADDQPSTAAARRIKGLERELARKEKALAEAAALLILKKKGTLSEVEDDDTDEGSEK